MDKTLEERLFDEALEEIKKQRECRSPQEKTTNTIDESTFEWEVNEAISEIEALMCEPAGQSLH